MQRILLSVIAIAGLAAGIAAPVAAQAAASNTYNLESSATIVEPGLKSSDHAVQIVANEALSEAAGKYGGDVVFHNLDGTSFNALTTLSTDYQIKTGDCGGGSPRFYTDIDTDGNGTADKRIVYYFTQNNATCGTAVQNTGNLADATSNVQVSDLDGSNTTTMTVAEAKTQFATATITTASLVADFNNLKPDGQTAVFDNVTLNSYTYTFDKTKVSTASKEDCKDGGYKSMTHDGDKGFKNQGDCVSYYASNAKSNNAQKDAPKNDSSVMTTIKRAFSNLF